MSLTKTEMSQNSTVEQNVTPVKKIRRINVYKSPGQGTPSAPLGAHGVFDPDSDVEISIKMSPDIGMMLISGVQDTLSKNGVLPFSQTLRTELLRKTMISNEDKKA